MEEQYTQATKLLDFHKESIVKKTQQSLGFELNNREKLIKLYAFVSSMPLGYSANDDLPASRILADGYGQCNTKVVLLMAMARTAGIPCRLHAYRISKDAQIGRLPSWILFFAPKDTLFFWPEFFVQGSWEPLQKVVHVDTRPWHSCPFDGAKYQSEPLKRHWIEEDQGIWPSPDAYFVKHKPSVHGWRVPAWHVFVRRLLNRNAC